MSESLEILLIIFKSQRTAQLAMLQIEYIRISKGFLENVNESSIGTDKYFYECYPCFWQ